jgi:hypothetical protein
MATEQQLIQLVEALAEVAGEIFENQGYINGVYIIPTADSGWHFYEVPDGDPRFQRVIISAVARQLGVEVYAHVDEAWSVNAPPGTEVRDIDPATDPDCVEMVVFTVRDGAGHIVMGERPIIRDKGKPPRLGALRMWRARQVEVDGGRYDYTELADLDAPMRH